MGSYRSKFDTEPADCVGEAHSVMGRAAAATGLVAQGGNALFQSKALTPAMRRSSRKCRTRTSRARRASTKRPAAVLKHVASSPAGWSRSASRGVAIEGNALELLAQNAMELEREALDARIQGLRGYQAERQVAR